MQLIATESIQSALSPKSPKSPISPMQNGQNNKKANPESIVFDAFDAMGYENGVKIATSLQGINT